MSNSRNGKSRIVCDGTFTDREVIKAMKDGASLRAEYWFGGMTNDKYILYRVPTRYKRVRPTHQACKYEQSPWYTIRRNYYIPVEQVTRLASAGKITKDKHDRWVVAG